MDGRAMAAADEFRGRAVLCLDTALTRAGNQAGKGERVHASITLPQAEPPPEDGQDEAHQEDGGQSGQ